MEIDIQITERQRKALNDWCVANEMNMAEYLGKKVWDAFLVDKYGDLNDKVPKVADKKEKKKPEGVVMAPYELQLDNVVTITTPSEWCLREIQGQKIVPGRAEMNTDALSKFNVSEPTEEEAKKETKAKTPKKITLTPVK